MLPQSKSLDPLKSKNYGKVPRYIDKFNKERQEAKHQREIDAEMAKLPPGTRLLPEDERLSTLKDLQAAKKATNDQIEKLPISMKSQKAQ